MNQTPHFGKLSAGIIIRDPAELRPHPLVKDLPRWAKDDPRFYGLCDDIRDNGIKIPLQITQDGRVLDGETCRQAARALQMDGVPCVIVPDDQATETVLRGLVRRRHLTKSQLAFLVVPLIQPAFEESQRRMNWAKKGSQTPANSIRREDYQRLTTFSVAEYAENMGMSARFLQMARTLLELIAANPGPHEFELEVDDKPVTRTMMLKEWVILRLFDAESPQGLTEINKAAGYFVSCWESPGKRVGGPPKTETRQMELFEQTFKTEVVRWNYWASFDDKQKLSFFKKVQAHASSLSPTQVRDMAEYHEVMARTLRNAAKQAVAEEAA